jgi:hypothetical protein
MTLIIMIKDDFFFLFTSFKKISVYLPNQCHLRSNKLETTKNPQAELEGSVLISFLIIFLC